jgi:enoyl-CoA hydratase/carnithine racemase
MASLIPHLRRIQQPIIAAINGAAYGGGLALALGCDVRIAARSAKLCVQFIRVGVSGCDIGTSYLLPRLIGASRAHDLILSARVLDADEAERYGLVTRVVPDAEILSGRARARRRAVRLHAVRAVRDQAGDVGEPRHPEPRGAIQLENRNQIMAGASGETRRPRARSSRSASRAGAKAVRMQPNAEGDPR